MPNWCYNNVKISFDSENEQELRDKVRFDKDLFCQFAPMPESVGDGWYEWNISNWGTKWDAQPFDINWEDDCVTFQLETAWSPPLGFYEKMEQLGYEIDAYYLEEGMAFIGYYEAGFDDYYEYGNMSAATTIIALDEAQRSGRIQSGDLVELASHVGLFVLPSATLLDLSWGTPFLLIVMAARARDRHRHVIAHHLRAHHRHRRG